MRFVIFTHSLVSDWNHGNAHFLRGIASELISRGHSVKIFEPEDGWSRSNLIKEHGIEAIAGFEAAYPDLRSDQYNLSTLDPDELLANADAVIVHEWNSPEVVSLIGQHRSADGRYQLFFHDTHHRSLTDKAAMAAYDLRHYDGVLAYGKVILEAYLENHWVRQGWVWHEAADTRMFHPLPDTGKDGDLVWIGNWGDGERVEYLRHFLIEPVKNLNIRARVYGVRYPASALAELADAGIEYGGWLPNYRVPEVFNRFRVTVHVPRGPYISSLPGIPTIRPFEAMACGIPMVSAPWIDSENLFTPGKDFLFASDGAEMEEHLRHILSGGTYGADLASHGLDTIRSRHTCSHRVDELLSITSQRSAALASV